MSTTMPRPKEPAPTCICSGDVMRVFTADISFMTSSVKTERGYAVFLSRVGSRALLTSRSVVLHILQTVRTLFQFFVVFGNFRMEIGIIDQAIRPCLKNRDIEVMVVRFGRIRHLCENLVALFHEAAIHQETLSILRHSCNTRLIRKYGMSAFGLSPMSNDMSRIGHLRVSWHG